MANLDLLFPTSQGDLVSSIASQHVAEIKENLHLKKKSLDEIHRESRQRQLWTMGVGIGACVCFSVFVVLTSLTRDIPAVFSP